jgi:hypothetical protein
MPPLTNGSDSILRILNTTRILENFSQESVPLKLSEQSLSNRTWTGRSDKLYTFNRTMNNPPKYNSITDKTKKIVTL